MSHEASVPAKDEPPIKRKWRYFASGVLIPVVSTLAYNVLDMIFRGKLPNEFEPKDLNVSIGCAFAIFSMAAVSRHRGNTQDFMIVAALLTVTLTFASAVTIAWFRSREAEWAFFIVADIIAMTATAWAVNKTADES